MSNISDNQQTFISFNSKSDEMGKILESKLKLDEMFKQFTNQGNALNSYIDIYNKQRLSLKRPDNDSDRTYHGGKKKFCSNFSANDDEYDSDDNNNNNNKRSKKSLVRQRRT
jgi:hypothetical protein